MLINIRTDPKPRKKLRLARVRSPRFYRNLEPQFLIEKNLLRNLRLTPKLLQSLHLVASKGSYE